MPSLQPKKLGPTPSVKLSMVLAGGIDTLSQARARTGLPAPLNMSLENGFASTVVQEDRRQDNKVKL